MTKVKIGWDEAKRLHRAGHEVQCYVEIGATASKKRRVINRASPTTDATTYSWHGTANPHEAGTMAHGVYNLLEEKFQSVDQQTLTRKQLTDWLAKETGVKGQGLILAIAHARRGGYLVQQS